MKDVTISARVSEQLSEQLELLAQATRRSKSWLIEEALRSYLAAEGQFIQAVEEGLAAMDAGDVVDHAVVVEDIRRRRRAEA